MENNEELKNSNEKNKYENTEVKIVKKGFKFLLKIIIAFIIIGILLTAFLKIIFKVETADTKDDKTAKKWQTVAGTSVTISGSSSDSNASISSRGGTVVQKAIECHKYLREHKFTYNMNYGKSIPEFLEASEKVVDCSTFVSWVLYQSGLDSFKGGQEADFNSNPHELKRVSEDDIQPGDVLVYSGHVEIAAKVENKKVTLVYNNGDNNSINAKGSDEYPETSTPHESTYVTILRVP